jgi:hypothetical protein
MTETMQKHLLQVPNLLLHDTILLGLATDLLGEVLDFLDITNKAAPLLRTDALSVVLQLKQVLGISGHVCPATVVVNLKAIVHLIHASLPLWVRVVLDRIQQDGRACSSSHVLRAQGSECHVSSLLHSIVHVGPNSPRGPWAPVRKHRVGRNIGVDLTVLQIMLLIEPTVVPWGFVPIANLHKGIPQQQREAMLVQTPHTQVVVLEGAV